MARDVSSGLDPSMQYLSGAYNGSSADATLSRIVGVGADTVRKVQFCVECGARLESGGYKPSKDAPEVYCKQHYDELYGAKCEGCNQPLSGQVALVDGKKYHQQCYSQDVACHGCRKRVFGQTLQACGHMWHPDCFKCTLCYDKLGTDFIDKQGLPYCKKCAAPQPALAAKSADAAKVEVEAARKKLEETKLHNAEARDLAAKLEKGKMFCGECGQSLGVGDAVEVSGGLFHLECLRCNKCNAALAAAGGYKVVNGAYVCAKCVGASGTAGGFCAGCGKQLSGPFLNAMGAKWHKECFVCTSCKKPFQGSFAEKGGHPYCAACVAKAAPPPQVTLSGPKVGFTVDPRTGEKKYTTPR